MEGRGGYVQLRPSIAYVKEQLGHSSIQVTVDVYGHFIPGANRAAVDRLAKAVERGETATKRDPGATRKGSRKGSGRGSAR